MSAVDALCGSAAERAIRAVRYALLPFLGLMIYFMKTRY